MRTSLTSPDDLSSPVTLPEVKAHARIEHSQDDTRLQSMIDAVTELVEKRLRVPLIQRRFVQTVYGLHIGRIELARAPVQSVASITDGTTALTEGDGWERSGDTIHLSSLPEDALTIEYTAGLAATQGDVPDSIKQAIKRQVATAYEHPTDTVVGTIASDIPIEIQTALSSYMRVRA